MSKPFTCIKGNFDATLTCLDGRNMIYRDMSEWTEGPLYATPDSYKVGITPPGRSISIQVDVSTSGPTSISNKDLGINATNLLDGVYTISVYNCGTTYTRSKAVLGNIQCRVQKYISTLNHSDYAGFKKAAHIEWLIKSSMINSELNKSKLAQDFYKAALREIDKLNCDCKC
jgi:hypothetical protein